MPYNDNEPARMVAVGAFKVTVPVVLFPPCACNWTWGTDGRPLLRPCAQHLAARCTCPTAWFGIVPPPPCAVHGQPQMVTVTC